MDKLKKFEGAIFLVMITIIAVISSCGLSEPEDTFDVVEQFEMELDAIDSYLETNLIVADTDSISLIRYVMLEEGTGVTPESTDSVNITYEGKLLNGQVFDSGTRTFKLNNLIGAWQIMMRLVKEDGTIEFYAPSFYCYGRNGSGPIPPNTPLLFNITLHEVIPSP